LSDASGGRRGGRSCPRIRRPAIPAAPGTYVLILEASRERRLRIGALGKLQLEPGFFAYVGSARGPGGLAARLAHHCRRARSAHWHIDYLRRHTAMREIWFARGTSCDREHAWATALGEANGASIPLSRFGASDCGCATHLFRFSSQPALQAMEHRLAAAAPGTACEVERWMGRARVARRSGRAALPG
jgi:Uri superfamily endonuclease